jgi:hypothetical protein
VVVEAAGTDGIPTGMCFRVGDPLLGRPTLWSFGEFIERLEKLDPAGNRTKKGKLSPDFFGFAQVVHWGQKPKPKCQNML